MNGNNASTFSLPISPSHNEVANTYEIARYFGITHEHFMMLPQGIKLKYIRAYYNGGIIL